MKSKGFSAPELTIAVGLFAVMAVIFTSLWLIAQGGLNEISASHALSENLQDLRTTLSVERSCSLNLVGTPLALTNTAGVQVSGIKTYDPNGVELALIFETGAKRNGITFERLTLKPNTQVDLSHITADLEIEYKKNVQLGKIAAVRHIPLIAQVQQGRVQKCWVRRDSTTHSHVAACMALTSGSLNEYDPLTLNCAMTNGRWFDGTDPHFSVCPAGTDLPKNVFAWSHCAVEEPAGFIDPVLTDDGALPYIMTINRNARRCRCDYDLNIPPATIARFKCRIYCVVL